MLSNQQLYLLNHFALVARRHGLHLPELKELHHDEKQLRQWIDFALSQRSQPAVMDAAAKLATALSGQGPAPGAAASPDRGGRPPPLQASPPSPTSHSAQVGMNPRERALALAALQDAAGPIAGFIAEQVDAMGPLSLAGYLDQAATLAQLSDARRRGLLSACGLAPD